MSVTIDAIGVTVGGMTVTVRDTRDTRETTGDKCITIDDTKVTPGSGRMHRSATDGMKRSMTRVQRSMAQVYLPMGCR